MSSSLLPEYPLSREEQQNLPQEDSSEVSLPSQLSFAQEVRAERLGILWKVTLFAAFMIWWSLIVISGGRDVSLIALILPTLSLSITSVMTGQFLKRELFNWAVWSYAFGGVATITLTIAYGETFGSEYAPYFFPILVFVIGLLIPVRDSMILLVVTVAAALLGPAIVSGEFDASQHTWFSLILTVIATGLSAQVSGELYAIAEWALENYRKERQTTFALFESRTALEKSLMRQQALNDQVQAANKELESARKSEEEAKNFRGQFLANMSHELRTPLNAIIGFSQTMLDFPAMYDGVMLPEQYQQDMSQILNSGKHLLNIINDILDLSKVDAGKLDLEIQPVDLGPVIKGVLSTAVGLVGDKAMHVKLLRETPDPLPMCLGDPLRVRQVMLNLYSNAAKFTDTGYIKFKLSVVGTDVIFAVEDTGIGIPEADRTGIFEEFRQGTAGRKKGRQGAGLGLAISQQLLRLMNGRMWFDSTLGKGSTFFFSLPLYVVPAEDSANEPVITAEATQPTQPVAPVTEKAV